MANTFKIDTKSSVVTDAVSSTNTNILSAGGSATLVLLSILVSNKTGASADVDVFLVTTGDDVYLLRNAPIPAGSSLELISGSKVIIAYFTDKKELPHSIPRAESKIQDDNFFV